MGGYEVVFAAGFKTPRRRSTAFRQIEGAGIAVICSTDENYPALVPALAAGSRAQQTGRHHRAGRLPAAIRSRRIKQSGVNEFIHIRADAVEVLSKIQNQLGIE